MRDRPVEDLTARARIRDAALAQLAERGFKGTTMKGIADAAGVSVGLVQHHFGTKDELQRACDAHVLESLEGLDRLGANGAGSEQDFLAELFARSPLITRYLARAMVEGSPAAAALFDSGARAAEAFLTRAWPERLPPGSARARDASSVMAAMHLATIVLHEHLSRRMGVDVLAYENAARIGMAIFDIYACMAEFIGSQTGKEIRDAAVKHQQAHHRRPAKDSRHE